MIVNILSAVVIDKMIYGMNSGKVAFIVTKNGKRICDVIDECSQRGSTILKAQGGYKQDDIHYHAVNHSVNIPKQKSSNQNNSDISKKRDVAHR